MPLSVVICVKLPEAAPDWFHEGAKRRQPPIALRRRRNWRMFAAHLDLLDRDFDRFLSVVSVLVMVES